MSKKSNVKKQVEKVDNIETISDENTNSFYIPLIEKKIDFFAKVVEKTIIHVQKNKFLDILGISDVGTCIDKLSELDKKIEHITTTYLENDVLINYLQTINIYI